MAKIIKLTADVISQAVQNFKDALTNSKFSDGEITFRQKLFDVDRKATVIFKETAWLKMQSLIREWNNEIAWHGIAKRGDGSDDYIIEDILVYPQEVTGATVTTDQEQYQMWLMQQDDDTFNNIRMQGHSHVNMPVSPSGVDNSLYERILAQLTDDMFYIFLIWNKRGDKTIKIYDLAKNIFFDTSDCKVEIEEEIGMETFLEEARKLVKDKPKYTYSGSAYVANKYGHYSSSYPISAADAANEKKESEKKEKKTEEKETKEVKRKGKRKETAEEKYEPYDPWQMYREYM